MAKQQLQVPDKVAEIRARQYETRLVRLLKLIDLEYNGVTTWLAKKGTPEERRSRRSYISQLKTRHRSFAEDSARRLEVELSKPVGWLDGLDDPEFDKLEALSNGRVGLLRKLIRSKYRNSLEAFFTSENVGVRRRELIENLLHGTRWLSASAARRLEAALGLTHGFLEPAPVAEEVNEPVRAG